MKAIWSAPAMWERWGVMEYIAQRDPAAALKLDLKISDTVARIEQFPNSGRIGRLPGTREAIIGSYILVYRILNTSLYITHFVHGAQDFPCK